MTKTQRARSIAIFGTDSFLPVLEKLSRMKGKGIEVTNIISMLQFLEEAADIDVVSFIKSGRADETRDKLKLIAGTATLIEFNAAIQSLYVPLRQIGGGASLTFDPRAEMAALGQPLQVQKPDGLSAAAPRTGKPTHPDAPKNTGTRTIRAV